MPIGVICNVLAVAVGGVIGTVGGSKLKNEFKEKLNLIFGVCSMGIGISSIVLMHNMPAVVLSLILGTIIGIALHLGNIRLRLVQQIGIETGFYHKDFLFCACYLFLVFL